MATKNYWGFRTSKNPNVRKIINNEIEEKGQLRQGWGYPGTDLTSEKPLDAKARKNRPIFSRVKKGDILLVPHIPTWNNVIVVEATEDFDKGYKFEPIDLASKGINGITPNLDYGHIFPVKKIKIFDRHNVNIEGNIRSTLKYRGRFWNMNRCEKSIEKLLQFKDEELIKLAEDESKIQTFLEEIFDENAFADKLYSKITSSVQAAEWEEVLVYGLKKLYPLYDVEKVGGSKEKEHGADILIRLPGLLCENEYAIAIQVKDYKTVNDDDRAVEQIKKSETYWEKKEGLKLIDKIVIYTGVKQATTEYSALIEKAEKENVKLLFAEDVKSLLCETGKKLIGETSK